MSLTGKSLARLQFPRIASNTAVAQVFIADPSRFDSDGVVGDRASCCVGVVLPSAAPFGVGADDGRAVVVGIFGFVPEHASAATTTISIGALEIIQFRICAPVGLTPCRSAARAVRWWSIVALPGPRGGHHSYEEPRGPGSLNTDRELTGPRPLQRLVRQRRG
jgi:hypothetical protein